MKEWRGTLSERVDRNAIPEPNTGCFLWLGKITPSGYARVQVTIGGQRLSMPAHRAAYEMRHGPVPKGLVLDHLCRVRSCVNPDHLEPVTNRENVLRGVGPAAKHARQTHCKHGHEYTPENTRFNPRERERKCLACCSRYNAWRRQQRAARKSVSP